MIMIVQHAQDIRQPEPGIAIQQQPQQGGGQWVYVQTPVPQPQQTLWGYLQQAQQGQPAAQPVQLIQPGLAQWGYAPQPQAGMAQMAYLPPGQDFAAQGGQFGQFGTYDLAQRFDVPQHRKGPKNYVRSDERIRELICERLIQDMSLDVSEVSIDVKGGRVTVGGTVPHRQMKHAIEDMVDGCWGVREVESDLRVHLSPPAASFQEAGRAGQGIGQSGGGFAGSGS